MNLPSPRGSYSTREVAALLGMTLSQVRGCVRAGFVTPRAGAQGEMLFSFQDLVLLRTAKELLAARIPHRRIRAALENLHNQLPRGRALTGVRISAQGHHVVARDGGEAWHPESGQTLIDFEVAELARGAAALKPRRAERPRPLPPAGAEPSQRQESSALAAAEDTASTTGIEDWFARGVELEAEDPQAAAAAYRRALEAAPGLADAHLNLGRLLHEAGDPAGAEAHYRQALAAHPADALAAYNLGVALQDQQRPQEAVAAYEQALDADPGLADAHFNLSGIYEQLGEKAAAFRHLRTYRTLTGNGGSGGS
jgi:tetratricopeptide (TPR) repeat protein